MKFRIGTFKVGDPNCSETSVIQVIELRKRNIALGVSILATIFIAGLVWNFSGLKMFWGIFLVSSILILSLRLSYINAKNSTHAFRYTWFKISETEILFYEIKEGQKVNFRKIDDLQSIKIFPHPPSGGFQMETPRFKFFPAIKKVEIVVVSNDENRAKLRLEEFFRSIYNV